jgi:hypothetical protein
MIAIYVRKQWNFHLLFSRGIHLAIDHEDFLSIMDLHHKSVTRKSRSYKLVNTNNHCTKINHHVLNGVGIRVGGVFRSSRRTLRGGV